MYPFIYKVEIFNSDYMAAPKKIGGITFSETFSEATSKIESAYGEELCDLYLAPLEEGEILEFPKEEIAEDILNEY